MIEIELREKIYRARFFVSQIKSLIKANWSEADPAGQRAGLLSGISPLFLKKR